MGGNILLSIQMYLLAIVISMLVAVMIRGIVSVLSAAKKKPATPPVVMPAPVPDDPARNDIAAIAAAVCAVMGAHRVLHIEDARRGVSWTTEGRMTHHTSHAVPHHPRR